MNRRGIFWWSLFLCGVSLCGGCSRSPRVSFYTLASPSSAPAAPAGGALVAVGAVTLPEMVDRPQLVVRQGENRVDVLEAQRWGEPLKTGIARLLAQDLNRRLGVPVAWYPQFSAADAPCRVQVDIQRFEGSADAVTVEALWAVRQLGDAAPRAGHTLVREPVREGGYEAMVAAFSRALSSVSADLAQAVRASGNPATRPGGAAPGSP